MNTSKILDIVPQAAPAPAQPAITAPRTQAVPAIGDGATSDAIRQHAERQAEAAAAEAERKRNAPKAELRQHNFDRKVGLVDDTFQVFVDLVNPSLQSHRFRIFGPPDKAAPPPVPTNDLVSAHAAYAGSGQTPPVLKTDV